jgi:hypothetical protein
MNSTITLCGYAVLVVLMIVCEVMARRSHRIASLEDVPGALARWRAVWIVVIAAWLWVGWHVFVRSHHD